MKKTGQNTLNAQSNGDARLQFESGMISVFAELADHFGNPRSHGQIYGLLFSSPEALAMDEIARRTGISMGSTSMGQCEPLWNLPQTSPHRKPTR